MFNAPKVLIHDDLMSVYTKRFPMVQNVHPQQTYHYDIQQTFLDIMLVAKFVPGMVAAYGALWWLYFYQSYTQAFMQASLGYNCDCAFIIPCLTVNNVKTNPTN